METPPRKLADRQHRILDNVVERVIPSRWRQTLSGDLRESFFYLSPGRYFLQAADLVAFALASEARRALRSSPLLDPNRIGMLIALIGYMAILRQTSAILPPPAIGVDFAFGIVSGVAIGFWLLFPAGRSPWIAAFLMVLVSAQVCFLLLDMYPGSLSNRAFGEWAIFMTLLAVSAAAVDSWILTGEQRR